MANCLKCGSDLQQCQCSCKNCENIVFNPVLAYCQFSLENYNVIEVSKAIEQYFCNEDVAAARDMLRNLFMDRLDELDIKKIATRKSSPNRTCLEANASDVSEAVYHLLNSMDPPRFATLELKKLPILTAVLANTRSQAEAVMMLEKKMLQVEQHLAEHSSILRRQDENITSLTGRNERSSVKPGSNIGGVPATHDKFKLALPPPMAGFGASGRQAQQAESLIRKGEHPSPSWSAVAACAQKDEAYSDSECDSQPWQMQRHERLRKQSQQQQKSAMGVASTTATVGSQDNNRRRYTSCLQGSAKNTQVKAGDGPNRDLWIFNVHKDMDDTVLQNFIKEGGSTKERNVKIRLFEARYKKDADSKQFRLTIGKCDYEYVYQAAFWPIDVSVRKYWVSSTEKSTAQVDKNS